MRREKEWNRETGTHVERERESSDNNYDDDDDDGGREG